jgi:glutamate-1-semialdehyde 2,1-aminomutase
MTQLLSQIDDAVWPQRDAYIERNPVSAQAFESAKAAGIAGGTNRASIFYSPFPLTFIDGEGARVKTADGQTLTDFLGNFTAGLFGYSPEPVIQAVTKAMGTGHALGGGANHYEARAAAIMTERFPSLEMVRFSNTGSEANTYAINTARAVTGRSKILVYDGAYHGAWIHGGASAGPLDTPYEKITVPFGDAEAISNAILEHQADLAAVLIEPVMVNPVLYLKQVAPASYLQPIRAACDQAGCALIFDEVMTSRLAPGGAQALVGVTPDITTFGKYFGGGLPLGGFGGKRDWMERHDPLHPQSINSGGTFNQNPISLAAMCAVLEELWTPDICVQHNARGDAFRDAINAVARQHNAPCQAMGTGSLMTLIWQGAAVLPHADDPNVVPLQLLRHPGSAKMAELFWFDMLLEHDLLAGRPMLNYLTLPTPLTADDESAFLDALSAFFVRHKGLLRAFGDETAGV